MPIFCVPTGVIRFCSDKRVDDVVRGNAVVMQRLLVEVGLDLAHLAAERQRHCGTGNRRQLPGG